MDDLKNKQLRNGVGVRKRAWDGLGPRDRVLDAIVQQLFVPFFSFFALVLTEIVIGRIVGAPFSVTSQLLEFLLGVIGFGLISGLAVYRISPGFAESGKGIWILPVLMLTACIAADSRYSPLTEVLGEYFLPPNQYAGGGLLIVLITYPACATLAYSSAIFLASRSVRGVA